MSIRQTKITVISPKDGEESFIVVNHINDHELIRAKQAIDFALAGLTPGVYRAWTENGIINTFSGNGNLRIDKYDTPYICIKELEKAVVAIPKRKHDKVNKIKSKMRVAV